MNLLRPLGELCEFVLDGTHGSPIRTEKGIPVLSAQNVKNGTLSYETDRFTSLEEYRSFSKRLPIAAGDVLLTIVGTIGRVAVVESPTPAVFQRSIAVLRPKSKVLDSRFLYHASQAQHFRTQLDRATNTSSQAGVYLGRLKEVQIPLPPLPEQRRIAAILDHADALRAKRRAAIAKLDSLAQSIFFDMFGDPVRNELGWVQKPLGEILTIRRGGSPRPIENYLGGTINWIKIGDATKGDEIYISQCADKITESGLNKTVYLRKGSLIFANCGVSLGFARILKVDGCIHDGWLSFEDIPESILNKLFLLKALNVVTQRFRKMAPDGTQPNLNTQIMKAFPMILPPIERQLQFSLAIGKLMDSKAAQTAGMERLDTLIKSLQEQAFSG